MDVDLVMSFNQKMALMPLRNLYGEPALDMFKEIHLLHLININSKQGVIPFNIDFKTFLSEEVKFSIRKVEYVMKDLISLGLVLKKDKVYSVEEKMKKMFAKDKMACEDMPWKDQPNYN